jgi:glycosyltransferase involved in cell wall biosynthesis
MIATAVGGITEIFGAGSAAVVRPDASELAELMSDALADPDAFAAKMPTTAALRARFGADVMATEIEKAYLTALGR